MRYETEGRPLTQEEATTLFDLLDDLEEAVAQSTEADRVVDQVALAALELDGQLNDSCADGFVRHLVNEVEQDSLERMGTLLARYRRLLHARLTGEEWSGYEE